MKWSYVETYLPSLCFGLNLGITYEALVYASIKCCFPSQSLSARAYFISGRLQKTQYGYKKYLYATIGRVLRFIEGILDMKKSPIG